MFACFLQIFAVFLQRLKSQSRHPTNGVAIPRSSETDESSTHVLSVLVVLAAAKSATEDRFQRRRTNRLTLSTHAVRSIVAPFKSLGTVRTINSREGRHEEWTCSTKISESRSTPPPHIYLGRGFCTTRGDQHKLKGFAGVNCKCVIRELPNKVHIAEQPVKE